MTTSGRSLAFEAILSVSFYICKVSNTFCVSLIIRPRFCKMFEKLLVSLLSVFPAITTIFSAIAAGLVVYT